MQTAPPGSRCYWGYRLPNMDSGRFFTSPCRQRKTFSTNTFRSRNRMGKYGELVSVPMAPEQSLAASVSPAASGRLVGGRRGAGEEWKAGGEWEAGGAGLKYRKYQFSHLSYGEK